MLKEFFVKVFENMLFFSTQSVFLNKCCPILPIFPANFDPVFLYFSLFLSQGGLIA